MTAIVSTGQEEFAENFQKPYILRLIIRKAAEPLWAPLLGYGEGISRRRQKMGEETEG